MGHGLNLARLPPQHLPALWRIVGLLGVAAALVVPALRLDLPANAIGKDYRPLTLPIGISPSGSGLQLSLLGLHLGIDLDTPGFRLPFIVRLGFDDTATIGPTTPKPAN